MEPAAYSLYILRCADGSLYTGIAKDVSKRLQQHESGPRGAKYLRGKGPLRLAFQAAVGDRARALRIEQQVKRLSKPCKEALVAGRISLTEMLVTRSDDQASGSGGG